MSTPISGADFPLFFSEMWEGREAFPWQIDFAGRICAGNWPKYVAAPTGSGKTACLDAAVFALAVQASLPIQERTVGRRIFFIVNRRVIVDEAYERAAELCRKLLAASPGTVAGRVAAALCSLTGEQDARPLTCTQLRGGVYRDGSWAGSLLQPMIVCSTVDQAGSRLLFRGYGVSEQARPIHAALVAQDSVLIVDEAHISRPFIETVGWISKYRVHEPVGCQTIRLPFRFVQMTATPPVGTNDAEQVALSDADYENDVLKPRLAGSKYARLVVDDKSKGKAREIQMAKRLTDEAKQILASHAPRSIVVMVNRVATARLVAEELEKGYTGKVTLFIGRLRPLDRDAITRRIQEKLKTGVATHADEGPIIVVSTQCLEVGADLDFDALVTEASSLDSLRQRFGRLNRAGRDITPQAVIVLPADQNLPLDKLDDKSPCDPIYANAIPRTWLWLQSIADNGTVDFGINAMAQSLRLYRAANDDDTLATLSLPTARAPVVLPAYLDCWVQTSPTPAADPDVALFLHGPQRDMAEVQVCWRADLPEIFDNRAWNDTLSLCPPTSLECLPVPLHVFCSWMFAQVEFQDGSGDVSEAVASDEGEKWSEMPRCAAFIWRGPRKNCNLEKISDVQPGDTIVLRVQSGGWQALGILPDPPSDPSVTSDSPADQQTIRKVDVAEQAARESRHRAVLRIHRALWPLPDSGTAAAELMGCAVDEELDWRNSEIKELLKRLISEETPGWNFDQTQTEIVRHLAGLKKVSDLRIDSYPDRNGFVISTKKPLAGKDARDFEELDVDADELLKTLEPLELCDHTHDVIAQVESALSLLPLEPWKDSLLTAAALHDWGKADWRFQAMLRSSSVFAAMASGKILAKSNTIASSAAARREARQRAGLPSGFRHEMLSVQMAENAVGESVLPVEEKLQALTLHLLATHHGYGRPFAPVIEDEFPPDVSLPVQEKQVNVTSVERIEHPSHALDSGIAERFWQLTRHHGWWGLAFLEAVLRLADQRASAEASRP